MSGERQAAYFGGEAEGRYGYAQAVRVGDTVYVSGQIARDEDGALVGAGDMAAQLRAVYANIARRARPVRCRPRQRRRGGGVRHRRRRRLEGAGEVRHEAYGVPEGEPIAVASTLVQVVALAHPDFLVEIRCTARL